MRRVILLFAEVLLTSIGWSQTMNIHYKSGQTVEYNMDNIDYVEFVEKKQNNTQVSSEWAVDLGLSVKWASYNVGATSPEQYGELYAWGETTTKDEYKKENYLYYDANSESYVDIGTNIANTDYDVAHVKWGNNWRMPTHKELKELRDKCKWEWTNVNGVNGWEVIGTNGNSIFFSTGEKSILLWASDMEVNEMGEMGGKYGLAHCLCFSNSSYRMSPSGISRFKGLYVRPVTNYKDNDDDNNLSEGDYDDTEYFEININGETITDDTWGGSWLSNYEPKTKNGIEVYPYGGLSEQIMISDQDGLQYAILAGYTSENLKTVFPKSKGTYDVISSRGNYFISDYSDNVGMVISGGNMNRRTVTSGSLIITNVCKYKDPYAKDYLGREEMYATEGTFSFTLKDDWDGNENKISGKFRLVF